MTDLRVSMLSAKPSVGLAFYYTAGVNGKLGGQSWVWDANADSARKLSEQDLEARNGVNFVPAVVQVGDKGSGHPDTVAPLGDVNVCRIQIAANCHLPNQSSKRTRLHGEGTPKFM